ncbi:MAG: hypothetical protein JWM16_5910, partial [Verrucomicrobiales bacterium]|nr:hypothetical protein [Verrucomicrobiales bacterium]
NDNSGGLLLADGLPFDGLVIAPGESILFVESTSPASTNADQFRAWWGANLPPGQQIVFYVGNGLGSGGDGIRLYAPDAANDFDLVDSVDFGTAVRGLSFTYNTNTGALAWLSTNGVRGAFKADQADDIGSPGFHQGPVPLAITRNPTNLSVNAGDNATFTVAYQGLPRPRFQWYYKGDPIPGARFSSFTVTNAQADKLGAYSVVLNNGLQELVSSNGVLALNAAPAPPVFLTLATDQNVFIGQRATFRVEVSGVPQPTLQWRFNGTNIPGATAATLVINNAQTSDSGVYSVLATNSQGIATNQATLSVTTRPNLLITEIMPAQSTNGGFGGHNDWWELTSFDDHPVDLIGYRFDDSSALLATSWTNTNHVVIAPGESIVFVEDMTADAFQKWWGPGRLPANLQIITYSGPALSLSSLGDGVVLWNSGATEDFDPLTAEVFSTATLGVSFGYNPDSHTFGDLSQLGVFGAFPAQRGGDIGSPGTIRNRPEPILLESAKGADGFVVTFLSQAGRTYTLQSSTSLTAPVWTDLNSVTAASVTTSITNAAVNSAPQVFYRVGLQP